MPVAPVQVSKLAMKLVMVLAMKLVMVLVLEYVETMAQRRFLAQPAKPKT